MRKRQTCRCLPLSPARAKRSLKFPWLGSLGLVQPPSPPPEAPRVPGRTRQKAAPPPPHRELFIATDVGTWVGSRRLDWELKHPGPLWKSELKSRCYRFPGTGDSSGLDSRLFLGSEEIGKCRALDKPSCTFVPLSRWGGAHLENLLSGARLEDKESFSLGSRQRWPTAGAKQNHSSRPGQTCLTKKESVLFRVL